MSVLLVTQVRVLFLRKLLPISSRGLAVAWEVVRRACVGRVAALQDEAHRAFAGRRSPVVGRRSLANSVAIIGGCRTKRLRRRTKDVNCLLQAIGVNALAGVSTSEQIVDLGK
jgi:hypothetical protein